MEIRYGRAEADLEGLITDILQAWDIAIAALVSADSTDSDPNARIDLDAPSRRRGSTVRDVLLGIGEWRHGVNLADRREAAARADTTPPPQRLIDAEITQRYAGADIERIAAAWNAARDAIEAWAPHAPEEAAAPIGGPLGVVPLGTMVGAGAVAILRTVNDSGLISDTGIDASPLSRIALHSLIDSVGAVCAQAPGDGDYRLAITTPDIEIGVCASPGSWHLSTDVSDLPRLIGPTEMVWQITSGTRSPVTALARREIEVVDIGGLMHVARGLTIAPDLPGGEGLRAVFTAVDGMTSTASKLGSLLARLRRD